jgi:hypothetical protein
MQIDFYTKAVLTVIAIGVGLLVFDQKPVKDAQAQNAQGPSMILLDTEAGGLWHMNGPWVRHCVRPTTEGYKPSCSPWRS